MKIKMLKTIPGSIDGITVQEFIEGEEYDIEGPLLDAFMRMKVCEKVKEKPAPKRKDKGPAPENKDAGPAPENK